jgi:hypothetical protein
VCACVCACVCECMCENESLPESNIVWVAQLVSRFASKNYVQTVHWCSNVFGSLMSLTGDRRDLGFRIAAWRTAPRPLGLKRSLWYSSRTAIRWRQQRHKHMQSTLSGGYRCAGGRRGDLRRRLRRPQQGGSCGTRHCPCTTGPQR